MSNYYEKFYFNIMYNRNWTYQLREREQNAYRET